MLLCIRKLATLPTKRLYGEEQNNSSKSIFSGGDWTKDFMVLTLVPCLLSLSDIWFSVGIDLFESFLNSWSIDSGDDRSPKNVHFRDLSEIFFPLCLPQSATRLFISVNFYHCTEAVILFHFICYTRSTSWHTAVLRDAVKVKLWNLTCKIFAMKAKWLSYNLRYSCSTCV